MKSMAELVYSQFQKEGMENIDYVLYDQMKVSAGAQQTVKFFQNSSNSGKSTTNMTIGGQLPEPQAFLITSMECQIFNLDGKPFEGTIGGTDVIYPVNSLLSKAHIELNV